MQPPPQRRQQAARRMLAKVPADRPSMAQVSSELERLGAQRTTPLHAVDEALLPGPDAAAAPAEEATRDRAIHDSFSKTDPGGGPPPLTSTNSTPPPKMSMSAPLLEGQTPAEAKRQTGAAAQAEPVRSTAVPVAAPPGAEAAIRTVSTRRRPVVLWGGIAAGVLLLIGVAVVVGMQLMKGNKVRLVVVRSAGGAVSSKPVGIYCGEFCGFSFAHDAFVELTARPDPNFAFAGWGGACSGTTATCFVTLDKAASVEARFMPSAPRPGVGPAPAPLPLLPTPARGNKRRR